MSSSSGRLPLRYELVRALSSFTLKQKAFLLALGLIFTASLVGILWNLNNRLLVPVAIAGGSLSEGVIGFPAHANPLFALTDADRDVSGLVYSGLLKIDEQGKFIPDLAESYTKSGDGLVYDFKLKKDLVWQDGESLTADDVIFTIHKAQDSAVKSPRRAAWEGVRVDKISPTEIRFTLKKPYAAFLDNATLGILPKHIWQDIKPEAFILSEYNIKGIGSGPYRIDSVTRDQNGIPTRYDFSPFPDYGSGRAKIAELSLLFYQNEDELKKAYERGEIESFGSIPAEMAEKLKQNGADVRSISLPRTFAVFLNQSSPSLADRAVREALKLATDKNRLVSEALRGAGATLNGPVPPGSNGFLAGPAKASDPIAAAKVLEKSGWKKDSEGVWAKTDAKKTVRLEFTLATANAPELKKSAELLAADWNKLGAKVTVSLYDLSDLDQNLIRPRKFDALLFGEALGRDPDLYAFWHSSQRLAPGLNIAQYANSAADKLLEEARRTDDPELRARKYEKFQTELAKDNPAIFLYSPHFLYVLPKKIKGAEFPSLLVPAERFATVANWYIDSDRVWKIFTVK